ncbi:MAG: hypothetical protein Q8M15_04550 [Bacteroidota bacterium]|nr:hypothetical protein [Bacteroidota bacterium]
MQKLFYVLICIAGICSCAKQSPTLNNNVNTGTAGSIARFAVVGNTLYTVSLTHLNIFDVSDKNNPVLAGSANLGFNIETIFPRDDSTLFVGSSNGMYIFDIKDRLLPNQKSLYMHFTACDPVVANQTHAFITLSSNISRRRCFRSVNQLEVIDISNLAEPQVIKTIPMAQPQGLALHNNSLFVCDNGLKWFDITNPANPLIKKNYISIQPNDILTVDSVLIAIGDNGLSQYQISNDSLVLLSVIPLIKK